MILPSEKFRPCTTLHYLALNCAKLPFGFGLWTLDFLTSLRFQVPFSYARHGL